MPVTAWFASKRVKAAALGAVSTVALCVAAPGLAQTAGVPTAAASDTTTVVVTGQRASLQKAAVLKKKSDDVIDSIVSDDIGKFPDNTVAAAMQRIPGVQVANQYNNEISGVIIRGLGDIETTLDGREIFTGVGRGYAFQDLPAESVAGVDVYKSNSAELVEGGVAGVVNIKRQKPFNFKPGLTVAANLRDTYGQITKKNNGVASLLVSDRFSTPYGQMGVLVDASYSKQYFSRPISFNCDPRSANHGPPGAAGTVLPTCVGGLVDNGEYERPQMNAVFQWKPSDDLELYADGEYAGWKSTFATYFIFSDIFAAQNITNVQQTSDCFTYPHINGAGFPGAGTDPAEHLCLGASATFNTVPGLTSTQAKTGKTDQYIWGGGAKYHHDALSFNLDAAYIRSYNENRNTIVDIGKPIPSVNIVIDDQGHGSTVMPGDPLSSPADFRFANGLFQDYNKSYSTEFQTRGDGVWDLDSVLKQVQFGFRYADRDAAFHAVTYSPAAPGGNRVTQVNSVGLPSDFLIVSPASIPVINNGAHWYTPNPDFLRNDTDVLRKLYGQAPGDPAWDPTRDFDAKEKTAAVYVQGKYGFDLPRGMALSGLVGGRLTSTRRDLAGTGMVNGVLTPQVRHTRDNDFLPNASAKLQVTPQFQLRATYAKVLTRPFFGDLNPGITYQQPLNANIQPSASGGNPDLRPEKSDNYDVTAEYYFSNNSYVEIAAYDRKIKDRTAVGTDVETIGGVEYLVTQPLNLSQSELNGYEISTQYFFDFLPEGWNGLGVLANYTYAPSKVKDPKSPLNGTQIQGVSKTAYNFGVLYEKYGWTARAVYNWRDTYTDGVWVAGELTPNTGVNFNYVKPNGRLDFSVSYDINTHVTVAVEGVNVNGGKYHSYFDTPLWPHDIRFDDKFVGASLRVKY